MIYRLLFRFFLKLNGFQEWWNSQPDSIRTEVFPRLEYIMNRIEWMFILGGIAIGMSMSIWFFV